MELTEIAIVEYEPKYAARIAEMWSVSGPGWNGADVSETTDSVLRNHENSSHLHVYLALDGETVVGYCSLDTFSKDPQALFISLLNVCPAYHGRGVGKALVLRCVQRTRDLGYGQLDLYTWPGNTKAVPLYKKCGFFWEKREDTTHLLNFIPSVLNTEALHGFFADACWYADSTRAMAVEPDGRQEAGFEFLTYSWNHRGRELVVEFERTGRGIRCIETDDYRITVRIDQQALVFGRRYPVYFQLTNKSGQPLQVTLDGRHDRNISFAYKESVSVTGTVELEGQFYVGAIEEEQDSWATHPGVITELLINGAKARLKLGVETKFPATLHLTVPHGVCFAGAETPFYLDVQSNLDESVVLHFALPNAGQIAWHEESFRVPLEPKQRRSIASRAFVRQFTCVCELIAMNAQMVNGEAINFNCKLTGQFRGYGMGGAAERESVREVVNGPYSVRLDLKDNEYSLHRIANDPLHVYWFHPKLGKPFSDEFASARPAGVEAYQDAGWMVLQALYQSKQFAGLAVSSVAKLRADGLWQHFYEVHNRSARTTYHELVISDTFYFPCDQGVVPFRQRYVRLDETLGEMVMTWDSGEVWENWLFCTQQRRTLGLTWNPEQQLQFGGWTMFFEHHCPSLAPGDRYQTPPVTVAMDLFDDWRTFRAYALQNHDQDHLFLSDSVGVVVNHGNPFVIRDYDIAVVDYRRRAAKTTVSVTSPTGAFPPAHIQAGSAIRVPAPVGHGMEVLDVTIDDESLQYQRQHAVFVMQQGTIATSISKEAGVLAYHVDNGVLQFAVAPSISPGLFSLRTEGGEWLDSSFPKVGMKAWWNPWVGGVLTTIDQLPLRAALQESRAARFVRVPDSLGNSWEGIVVSCTVENYAKLRGLGLNHYYLTLPGSLVMCHTVEVIQESGRYLHDASLEIQLFFRPGKRVADGWFQMDDRTNRRLITQGAAEQRDVPAAFPLLVGSRQCHHKVLVYANQFTRANNHTVSNEVLAVHGRAASLSIPDGARVFSPPVFLLRTDDWMGKDVLAGLNQVLFKAAPEMRIADAK